MLSSKFNVYNAEWLDLVFANRNQTYGAYELRKNYNLRLNKALFIASMLFVSVVCSPIVYKYLQQDQEVIEKPAAKSDDDKIIKVVEYTVPPKKIEQSAAPKGHSEPVKAKTLKFVPPRVVPVNQITEDIPTMVEISSAVISSANQEGISGNANAISPIDEGEGGNGSEGIKGGGESNEPMTFGSIEQNPEFPGGFEAFAKYLRKNLRYPNSAIENEIKGRVFVNFIVEKDGSLTDIKIAKGIGFGCDEEAIRVLKKSPRWNPGIQNKQKVRVMFMIPIVFQME